MGLHVIVLAAGKGQRMVSELAESVAPVGRQIPFGTCH